MATIINKFNLYFKNIYIDYREVFLDVVKGAKARPLRATLHGTWIAILLEMFRTNDNILSYKNELIAACNKLTLVPDDSKNPLSTAHVNRVSEDACNGMLRQIDLGFTTIIYSANYNEELALFKAQCAYLQPSIRDIDRIVDICIFRRWLSLDYKMRDYDINPDMNS